MFLAILILLGVLALFTYDSNTRIVTEEFKVSTNKLPSNFEGFRNVQLSDLHGKAFGSGSSDLVKAVKNANPNIIVITGDLIEDSKSGSWAQTLLKKLKEIAPVYFVTGNHEWASGGLVELLYIMDDCGIKVFDNEYEVLEKDGQKIVLAGVNDPNGLADQKTPQQLFREIRAEQGDAYSILLAHRNNRLDTYAEAGADLVLSGHGHGGIIRLPLIGGLIDVNRTIIAKYDSGFYIKDNTVQFVSRGLGTIWHIPRFLNNPQVAVIVLKNS
jgi:predicted MPP superfamily phosphohydrolase